MSIKRMGVMHARAWPPVQLHRCATPRARHRYAWAACMRVRCRSATVLHASRLSLQLQSCRTCGPTPGHHAQHYQGTTVSRMGIMHARTPQARAARAAGAQRPCVRPGCRCRGAVRRRTPRGAAAARRARRGARRARRTPARRRARRWRPCARASRGSRHACWPPHALRRRLWRPVTLQRAALASDHHSTHRIQIEKFGTVGSIIQYPDGTASYSTDCFRGFVAYSVSLLYNRATYKSYELVRTTRNICLTTGKEGEGETPKRNQASN